MVQYLNPQQQDKVLDIGCGDGKFTNIYSFGVACVLGIDSSPSMIESATRDYGSSDVKFRVVDCRYLDKETGIVDGTWHKV